MIKSGPYIPDIHSDIYIYNTYNTLFENDVTKHELKNCLFTTLRTSIYPLGRYRNKCFFSIVGNSFESVVGLTFILYSFMLLVRNSLIFERIFSNAILKKIKHSKHRG